MTLWEGGTIARRRYKPDPWWRAMEKRTVDLLESPRFQVFLITVLALFAVTAFMIGGGYLYVHVPESRKTVESLWQGGFGALLVLIAKAGNGNGRGSNGNGSG